jgi:hypothetical protein
MALAVRADYEARLNWQVAGRSLQAGIADSLARCAVESVP